MTIDQVTTPPPPLVRGLPILGSALDLKDRMIPFLVEKYKEYGPIFRVRALNQELVIMAGSEANAFVTQAGAPLFSSYEAWTDYGKEFDADLTMQNVDGGRHAALRKFFKPGYSANALMADIPLLVDIAQQMIDRLTVGEEIVVLDFVRPIVTDQLGRALASSSPAEYLDDIITVVRTSLNTHVVKQWPKSALRKRAYQHAKARYQEFGRKIVELHRTSQRSRSDLIDLTIAATKQPELQFAFETEAQLIQMTLAPFVAGLDTASNECTFALYALLRHPAILEQCVQEADRLFANGIPTLNQLKSAEVLHHTMMETLRLYSIAPGVDRIAAQSFEFGGYRVEKGQRVFIASTVAHFLPTLYKDPDTFDITRYSEPRHENRQLGAYAPFGIGTHLCLGAGAAEVQIMLVLASILHMVRLEPIGSLANLPIKTDPTPTLGKRFKVRVAERRHRVQISSDQNNNEIALPESAE